MYVPKRKVHTLNNNTVKIVIVNWKTGIESHPFPCYFLLACDNEGPFEFDAQNLIFWPPPPCTKHLQLFLQIAKLIYCHSPNYRG